MQESASEAGSETPASNPAPAPLLPAAETACAPVEVGGSRVWCVPRGVGEFSASERATTLRTRLESLSSDPSFDVATIVARSASGAGTPANGTSGAEVVAGSRVLASIGSLDALDGATPLDTAAGIAEAARHALGTDRLRKTPQELLLSGAYAMAATVGFVVALVLLSRGYRRVAERARAACAPIAQSARIQSWQLLTPSRVESLLLGTLGVLRGALTFALLYGWLVVALSVFPRTAGWAARVLGYFLDALRTLGSLIVSAIPNLFFIVVIGVAAYWGLKILRFAFTELGKGSISVDGFHPEWAEPTYKLVRLFVLVVAFIMAFPYLPGSSSPAFQGVTVFLGLLLSFGSSSAVANAVAGVVLTYMRPFRVGDRVRIADSYGDVIAKTLLVTRIRTIKNVDVTIPNSSVLGNHMVNYGSQGRGRGLILCVRLTLGYDVDWRKAHSLLKAAATRTRGIVAEPAPFVFQTAFGDYSVEYELNAVTDDPIRMVDIESELREAIQDAFREAGVEILSPAYTSLRDGSPSTVAPASPLAPGAPRM